MTSGDLLCINCNVWRQE